ncbi:MAG: DUF2085 domain-containing protein [Firmicutes bacterium]|nr:DUF2085 domain-containing protein [Bacillota bacterium]
MRQLIVYLGRAVCHQFSDRSLTVGEQLPVCARCAGIFVGVLISHLCLVLFPDKRRTLPLLSVSILLALLCFPWPGMG